MTQPGQDKVASPARIYDYLLGGKDNYAADRAAGEALLQIEPRSRDIARDNRAFLARAVAHLASQGIRQFLDLGTGLPTQDNVHEVAARHVTGARVVYVDIDAVAAAHGRALLADSPETAVIQGDLRNPDAILDHAETKRLIDFTQPVGLIMVAVLHLISDDDDPYGIVQTYKAVLSSGSHLVLSHGSGDANTQAGEATKAYSSRASAPLIARTHEEISQYFTGTELLEPGLVWTYHWRPDAQVKRGDLPGRRVIYGGVAVKP